MKFEDGYTRLPNKTVELIHNANAFKLYFRLYGISEAVGDRTIVIRHPMETARKLAMSYNTFKSSLQKLADLNLIQVSKIDTGSLNIQVSKIDTQVSKIDTYTPNSKCQKLTPKCQKLTPKCQKLTPQVSKIDTLSKYIYIYNYTFKTNNKTNIKTNIKTNPRNPPLRGDPDQTSLIHSAIRPGHRLKVLSGPSWMLGQGQKQSQSQEEFLKELEQEWNEEGERPTGATPTPPKPVSQKAKAKRTYSEKFEQFWNLYPRKVGKWKAYQAYQHAGWNKKDTDQTPLLDSVRNHLTCEQWTTDGGRYTPHPATYLNQDRYLDEVQPRTEEPPAQPCQPTAPAVKEWQRWDGYTILSPEEVDRLRIRDRFIYQHWEANHYDYDKTAKELHENYCMIVNFFQPEQFKLKYGKGERQA